LAALLDFAAVFSSTDFAAADATVIPPDDVDWIKRSDLLLSLDSPRFRKKA
jgi:hypothetical protein